MTRDESQASILGEIQRIKSQRLTSTIVLEAPTGFGKSIVALELAQQAQGSLIVTATKQLQEQYAALWKTVIKPKGKLLHRLLGKSNFSCLYTPELRVNEAVCQNGWRCDRVMICPYFTQTSMAHPRDILVANYQFALDNPAMHISDLLVLDEVHLALDEVRRNHSVQLSKSDLLKVGMLVDNLAVPQDDWSNDYWNKYLFSLISGLRQIYPLGIGKSATPGARLSPEERRFMFISRRLNSAHLLFSRDSPLRVVDHGADLLVQDLTHDLLGGMRAMRPSHIQQTVLMSATIGDPERFRRLHSLPEDTVFLSVPSTFPVNRRPIRYRPVANMSSLTPSSGAFSPLVGAVASIIDGHPGQNGLVHTTSTQVAQALASALAPRNIQVAAGSSREEVFRQLKNQRGLVVISASAGHGIDLPYDDCRFQVITKVPWPQPNFHDLTTKLGREYYYYCTAANLAQQYGRIMRAEDDAGQTFILDSSFRSAHFHNVEGFLPTWFTEAVDSPSS